MWRASARALLGALLVLGVENAPVMQLDMYRAMTSSSVGAHVTQNDNLASLGGVLKYLHTEVIVESGNAQTRWARRYGIDAILKRRFKVRNRDGFSQEQIQFADFGPFVTFDQGQSTNPAYDAIYRSEGDFVGAQPNEDPGYAVAKEDPLFWWSVSGFCPNLPWKTLTSEPMTQRCRAEGLCQAKGSPENPNAKCIKYSTGDIVQGGLCDGGDDLKEKVPSQDPNGTLGCVYTYGKAFTVDLDALVGVKAQKCKGQPCQDWLDFRKNCDDDKLKRRFDINGQIIPARNATPEEEPFCVEYDVHPACRDCSSQACLDLNGTKEIGLPFWMGRCDPAANRRRVELLADAAGIKGALDKHQQVDEDVLALDVPCMRDGSNACRPNMEQGGSKGGPYCSREFSGVCFDCHIPGTVSVYRPDVDTVPYCPHDVLKGRDYQDMKPLCKSKKPTDRCCLYTDSCEGSGSGSSASLDADGMLLVAQQCWQNKSSEPMLTYLQRVAQEKLHANLDTKKADVQRFAYDQWGPTPTRLTFEQFQALLEQYVEHGPPPGPPPSPKPAPKPSGLKPGIIVLIVVACAVVLAAVVFFCYRRTQRARQPPLIGNGSGQC